MVIPAQANRQRVAGHIDFQEQARRGGQRRRPVCRVHATKRVRDRRAIGVCEQSSLHGRRELIYRQHTIAMLSIILMFRQPI